MNQPSHHISSTRSAVNEPPVVVRGGCLLAAPPKESG